MAEARVDPIELAPEVEDGLADDVIGVEAGRELRAPDDPRGQEEEGRADLVGTALAIAAARAAESRSLWGIGPPEFREGVGRRRGGRASSPAQRPC